MSVLDYQVAKQKLKLLAEKQDFGFEDILYLLAGNYAIKVGRRIWNGLYIRQNYYTPKTFTLYDNSNHIVFGIYDVNHESEMADDWYVVEWHE